MTDSTYSQTLLQILPKKTPHNFMNIQMMKILILVFLLLSGNSAFAKWYQVEMLVFEHVVVDTGGEQWNSGATPDYSNAINLETDTNNSGTFKKLPSGRYKLGGVNKVLKLSSQYRPIHHIAWQQPELTKSRAKKVHIKNPEARIDGTVNLRGGYLLHLDLDIAYFVELLTESITSFTDEGISEDIAMRGTYAQLKETRRIKLNELHYFDHPLFGVVMRVTRLSVE